LDSGVDDKTTHLTRGEDLWSGIAREGIVEAVLIWDEAAAGVPASGDE
jgi:hypothetical protein